MEFLNSIDIADLLLIIFVILLIAVITVIVALFGNKIRDNLSFKKFLSYARQKGLNEEEASILWRYSKLLGRDPFLSLELKATFEKIVDLYVQKDPNCDEKLVADMRKKLGFDVVLCFMPLVSTKDIDLFQGGKLTTSKDQNFEIALFDKDEKYMYWLLIDVSDKNVIRPKERVKITFVRKNDAVYSFSSKVEEVIEDEGRIILKIPHTFDMVRIQRRQYVRVETDFDAELITEDFVKLYGKITDISINGLRFCARKEEIPENLKINYGSKVKVRFQFLNEKFDIDAEVKVILEKRRIKCFGMQFLNITDAQEKLIAKYIKNEQKKMQQLFGNRR